VSIIRMHFLYFIMSSVDVLVSSNKFKVNEH